MPDEPEPPRKSYGFKPREFERANPAAPAAPPAAELTRGPDTTVSAGGKIEIHDLTRAGAGAGRQLGSNSVVNRRNEVHEVLRENFRHDVAAGHYDLGVLDDSKRRRRILYYWIAIIAFDTPFALFACWVGPHAAIPFVCSISEIVLFSSVVTWQTFFLRTHY
jgi:hypothetical protein